MGSIHRPASRLRAASRAVMRLVPLFAVFWLAGAAAVRAQPASDASASPSDGSQRPTFGDLLAASGVSAESLRDVPFTAPGNEDQRRLIEQILFRLSRVEPSLIESEAVPWTAAESSRDEFPPPGAIVELRGRVTHVELLKRTNLPTIYRCVMQIDGTDRRAIIWANHVPHAWLTDDRLNERAALVGVFATVGLPLSTPRPLVLLADRVAWHPDDEGRIETSPGRRLLGGFGVDVGLLDEVEHGKPLSREDRTAFYAMLAAVQQTTPGALIREARIGLDAYAEAWRDGPAPGVRDGMVLRKIVLDAASEGRYAIAPLFLDAENQTGQLVLLEGVARRAIRIAVEDPPAAASGTSPSRLDHYFELEIFTSDSQNLPIVCCVPSLPAKFPVGDAIRQRVRLAGFFFKLWRYDSRSVGETGEGVLQFEPTVAPLVIAAEPVWPLAEPSPASDVLGWIIAVAFVAGVAVIAGTLWWWSREDRRRR